MQVEDAVAPDELAALVEEIDRLEAELSNDGGISSKEEITFCAHLVLKSEMCRAFTGQRLFSDLCHDLLAADTARLYWDQSVYKKPAPEKIFPFHQDNGYTFIEPQPYLTCWVALTDATRENGCPNVIPGVHRLGARLHDYDDHHNGWTVKGLATENAVCVPARAGSIVCFSSLTPHMTGANTTDGVRKAYICQCVSPSPSPVCVSSPLRLTLAGSARRYAPDGVVSVGNERGERNLAADPDRQYYVLENGRPVPPPPMPPVA